MRLPLMSWPQATPRPQARPTPATHELDCPFCGQTLRVPSRAINTRCTDCHKHLRLEDIVIRGDSALSRVTTCGTILVEPSARFSGLLQGSEVVIAGRVMGTVIGTRRVEITSTGKVAGTIATRLLLAHDHALVDGQVNILQTDGSISTTASTTHQPTPHYAART